MINHEIEAVEGEDGFLWWWRVEGKPDWRSDLKKTTIAGKITNVTVWHDGTLTRQQCIRVAAAYILGKDNIEVIKNGRWME